MEEKFIKETKGILEELKRLEVMPELYAYNDRRSSAPKKEKKVYDNSQEGEILQALDETTDPNERKELLVELQKERENKKANLVNQLQGSLEKIKSDLQKEQDKIDRKIEYANKMAGKVKRIIKSNNALLKNRDKKSKVYIAAQEENAVEIEKKERLSEIIKNLKRDRKQIQEKIEFYNSINLEENGIEVLKSITAEKESEKSQNESSNENENKENSQETNSDENKSKIETEKTESQEEKAKNIGNKIMHDIATDYKNTHLNEFSAVKTDSQEKKSTPESGVNNTNKPKQLSKEEQEALINDALEHIDNKGIKPKKENIFKRLVKKIKSFKIIDKMKRFFNNVKYGIKGITGRTKLLPKAQKVDLGINKNQKEQEVNKEEKPHVSKYSLDVLLNNSSDLSPTEKQAIADYANTHGEQQTMQRYGKELAGAEIGLNVKEMKKDEKDNNFKEWVKVENNSGQIEKNAKKQIDYKNVIERMGKAAKDHFKTR